MSSASATYPQEDRPRSLEEAMGAWARFGFVAFQLAVLVAVCWQFNLHNKSFQQLVAGAFAAFLVHSALPLRLRAPFFLGFSLLAFWFVLGLRDTLALVGIGGVLIGLCHLPLSWTARVVALCAAGGVLAAFRSELLPAPVSGALWPVLGSVFMFRLALYLYDTSKDSAPVPLARRLAYFFMLPNAVFPLFPIVDYKTFQRNYYAGDPIAIYQRGVHWMVRGVVHLLLYRIVYQHCVIAPEDVLDAADLAQYLLATFLLYLQISGQFHLIVGTLHLFGFKLPETNHLYFLASSVTDFWRRINIYWKDFMIKTVYWPTVLRLRRRIGQTGAVIASTGLVFFVSWLLHSYQWFWLRDSFPMRATDVVFWGGLGLLATVNAALETRPRRRSPARAWLGERVGLLLRTSATFAVICLLWSVWSADDLEEWRALWILPESFELADLTLTQVLLFSAVGALLGSSLAFRRGSRLARLQETDATDGAAAAFWQVGARAAAPLVVLLALGAGWFESWLGAPGQFVAELRSTRLNKADREDLIRGYYEDLVRVEQFNTELWTGLERRPVFAHLFGGEKGADRKTDDLLGHELVPSVSVPWKLKSFSTNRWGMRDRDYELAKPEGTFRIALLGSSHLMGWGVADGENFEALIENRLNAEFAGGGHDRFELLNFGVSGYSTLQKVMVFDERALRFAPDAIVYIDHMADSRGGPKALARAVLRGARVPYPFLTDLAEQAGVTGDMSELRARKLLTPHMETITSWALERIAGTARASGIVPVYVYLPVRPDEQEEPHDHVVQRARAAGFQVLDLADVFADHEGSELIIGAWDSHPNSAAHAILADRIYASLLEPAGPLAHAVRGGPPPHRIAERPDPGEPSAPAHVGAPPPGMDRAARPPESGGNAR